MPTPTLYATLDAEWAQLVHAPATRVQLDRWHADDPTLAPFDDLATLVAMVQRRDTPQASDAVLAALARRANGDDLAARVLLQLLLPGAKALTRRLWWLADPQERAALVVATLYELIRTYPYTRRPARIAANLLADTRQRLLRAAKGSLAEVPLDDLDDWRLPADHMGESASATQELLALLGWAVAAGHLTRQQGRLIGQTRIADITCDQLGSASGLKAHSIRRRRQRAERALAAAVVAAGWSAGQPGRVGLPPCA